jgi:hypothetical protein
MHFDITGPSSFQHTSAWSHSNLHSVSSHSLHLYEELFFLNYSDPSLCQVGQPFGERTPLHHVQLRFSLWRIRANCSVQVGLHITQRHLSANSSHRIKCTKCKKNKTQQFFSKRQLDILFAHGQGRKQGNLPQLRCKTCVEDTNDQTSEMKCQGCEKWKPKDQFANSMRKHPDSAKCKVCTEIITQIEPISRDEEMERMPDVNRSLANESRLGIGGSRGGLGASDAYDDDDDDDSEIQTMSMDTAAYDTNIARMRRLNLGARFGAPIGYVSGVHTATNSQVDTESLASFGTSENDLPPPRGSNLSRNQYKFEDESDEEETEVVTNKRVPPRRKRASSPASMTANSIAGPSGIHGSIRDRTVPAMDDDSPWQKNSLSRGRVAPGGLPAASATPIPNFVGDADSVSIRSDGLPQNFNRMAYGHPAPAIPSGGGSRYTNERTSGSSAARGSRSKFAKPPAAVSSPRECV